MKLKLFAAFIFLCSTALLAQQPLAKPAAVPATPAVLPKPSLAFVTAYTKRSVWIDVRNEAQATLKLADENIKKLEEPMVAELKAACPQTSCGYDSSKNEFVPQAVK